MLFLILMLLRIVPLALLVVANCSLETRIGYAVMRRRPNQPPSEYG